MIANQLCYLTLRYYIAFEAYGSEQYFSYFEAFERPNKNISVTNKLTKEITFKSTSLLNKFDLSETNEEDVGSFYSINGLKVSAAQRKFDLYLNLIKNKSKKFMLELKSKS